MDLKNLKLDLKWALTGALPEPKPILSGLEAGMLGLMIAPGGTGKSFLALDIAASVAFGRPIAGGLFPAIEPGKVVYIAAEETAPMLARRLRGMLDLADAGSSLLDNLNVIPLSGVDARLLVEGKPTPFYKKLLEFSQGAKLVIIDPFRRFHDGDENSSEAVTQFVILLEQICKLTGAAMLGVHHTPKTAEGAQATARGSSALVDGVRWLASLAKMDDKSAAVLEIPQDEQALYASLQIIKSNYLAPQPKAWLKRTETGQLNLVKFSKRVTANQLSVLTSARFPNKPK